MDDPVVILIVITAPLLVWRYLSARVRRHREERDRELIRKTYSR